MMSQIRHLLIFVWVLIVVSACAGHAVTKPAPGGFQHDFQGAAVPWTNDQFDDNEDKFSFALFSDLTGGERDGVFALAAEQLRLLRPEFIIGVGDLIEGASNDHAELNLEWDSFDKRADRARAPVFHVGGNHDLSSPDMWQVWENRYGQRYYHFVYKNTLFLVLDTEDNTAAQQIRVHELRQQAIEVFDSQGHEAFMATEYGEMQERRSGRIGDGQAAYFRQVIARYPDVRWTFLFLHKPAWERDNEENFSSIETALSDRPYTVFHGHLHSYLYTQRHGRDYIRLGTTGGSHAPGDPMAIDHISLVTVSGEGIDIANLRMSGIFDKTGSIPLHGNDLCLEECTKK